MTRIMKPNMLPVMGNFVTEAPYQPLYDTVRLAATPQGLAHLGLAFFQQPVGVKSASDPRTFEDTNMYLAGVLPEGNAYYVTSIGVWYAPDRHAPNDVLNVLSRGVLSLQIGNREYLKVSPLAALPPSFPMYWAMDEEHLRDLLSPIIAEGEGVKVNPKAFEIVPVYIPPKQWFSAIIDFPTPVVREVPGTLGVILYGHLQRPVV